MSVHKPERLFLIDSIGPFFVRRSRDTINWSKVPHDHLEKKGVLPRKRRRRIRENFTGYVKRVAAIGYTGITVDELSRLALAPNYPPKLRRKIERYRRYYRRLFTVAREQGLKIFITSDVMFFNRWISEHTGETARGVSALLVDMLDELFREFPEIDGLVLRIGESDGVDVQGRFRSRLVIRTAREGNRLLRQLVPVFESRRRTLIFRTWTVGAYPIGDLMWNVRTYERLFRGVYSSRFIISMKYGESDFFRYLELNRHFLLDARPKLIELQTRREYEGFGEYPTFVGHQYARLRADLDRAGVVGLVGIQVWCQTGGWSRFRNFTFLKNSSFWNELNTHVTLKLFRDRVDVPTAVAGFLAERASAQAKESPAKQLSAALAFLDRADRLIEHTLYDPAFAQTPLYVNRSRLPPLVHAFWDSVTINPLLRALHRAFVDESAARKSIGQAFAALEALPEMRRLARRAGWPYADYRYHLRTFRLLAGVRALLYGIAPDDAQLALLGYSRESDAAEQMPGVELERHLLRRIRRYAERYPAAYRFRVDAGMGAPGVVDLEPGSGRVVSAAALPAAPKTLTERLLVAALRAVVRQRSAYRLRDRLLFNPATALVYGLALRVAGRWLPGFLNQQGMPLEKLLR